MGKREHDSFQTISLQSCRNDANGVYLFLVVYYGGAEGTGGWLRSVPLASAEGKPSPSSPSATGRRASLSLRTSVHLDCKARAGRGQIGIAVVPLANRERGAGYYSTTLDITDETLREIAPAYTRYMQLQRGHASGTSLSGTAPTG